jgi:uncharacterized surface protein with fasciclin (FAS1) repeats
MTRNRFLLGALAVVVLGIALPSRQATAGGSAQAGRNIVQVARDAGTFHTLIQALDAAGLTGTLSGQGHGTFTVFAPTDAAFAKLPAGTLESLLHDRAALKKVLLYHVLAGEVPASQVLASTSLTTLNGQSLTVTTTGGPKVNDSAIVATDIHARNGIIHVIDTVLVPR